MKKGRENFKIIFIGFSKEDLIKMFLPSLQKTYEDKLVFLGDHISFIGLCSNKIAQFQIRQLDFTILFRDSKTSTNAGFPTKVSESISLGVPVIVNDTSDIRVYIKNKYNGFIVSNIDDHQILMKETQAIMNLSKNEIISLKKNAIASNPFYAKNYSYAFKAFFDSILRG